jgi:phenylalanine-4-hydroxylase
MALASDIRQSEHRIHAGMKGAVTPRLSPIRNAEYLRRFGEIGCKAISSDKDYQMYEEAIRLLSIVKEAHIQATIDEAEKSGRRFAKMGELSEMAQIRNLHWWTVEYGLIGTLDNQIYGALLSSIGEEIRCMTDEVQKIPYSIDAALILT